VNDAWAAAVAVTASAAAVLAVAPLAELDILLQGFGAGTVVRTLIAYRARRRNPRRETFPIQVRWGIVGLVLASGVLTVVAVW
jgi:hypothetical protein